MTEQVKNLILEKIAGIEDTLEEYYEKSVEILSTDIDETLEEIAEDRAELLERVGALMAELEEVTGECSPEEKNVVENAMKNQHVSLSLSAELKEIRKAIVKMRSMYLKAAENDKKAAARIDARVKELRAELEDLSGSRKTLDYFSLNKLGTNKGGNFDSSL